jgi:hypothetical protein
MVLTPKFEATQNQIAIKTLCCQQLACYLGCLYNLQKLGGVCMDYVLAIVFLIYVVFAWSCLNYLQSRMGLTFFTNFQGFMQIVLLKFFASALLGWLIIPIALIHKAVTKNR